ncbi:hypothetical protein Sjap_016630 [Stephania japonica]|uniref:Uncharacterized protein n=1 Tax=Stephania japonica TaxID=461633 RepID=A0AAP0NSK5_9MAGN
MTRRWSCWKEDFETDIFISHKHHKIRTLSGSKLQYKSRPDFSPKITPCPPIRSRHIATAVDLPTRPCHVSILTLYVLFTQNLTPFVCVGSCHVATLCSPNSSSPRHNNNSSPIRSCHVSLSFSHYNRIHIPH